jgi:methionyl-tRNA formyltransferase
VTVLTTRDGLGGRRAVVAEAADALELPVRGAHLVREPGFADEVRRLGVDLLLNVHSLFRIAAEILEAPRVGSFNLHPGPLPEYAGLNAPSWAIYNGEHEHAVTLHWMDATLDTGPVAYSDRFALEQTETGLSASAKCVRRGIPLISRLLADASRDPTAVPRIEQDLGRRRYFGPEPPDSGRIDWRSPSAQIVRFVRAADYRPFPSPWGHPLAELGGRTVGVAAASCTGETAVGRPGTLRRGVTAGSVLVSAGDEWVTVERLYVDGRYVPATAALR